MYLGTNIFDKTTPLIFVSNFAITTIQQQPWCEHRDAVFVNGLHVASISIELQRKIINRSWRGTGWDGSEKDDEE